MTGRTPHVGHETRPAGRGRGRSLHAWFVACVSCLALLPAAGAQDPVPLLETQVGLTGKLENVVLPGPELEAIPYDDRKRPIVIQELKVYPHGTAYRYDISYYGLDPGVFDLRDYLRRTDGTPAAGLPPIMVKVVPVRPPGQVEPNELAVERGPRVGGYSFWIAVGIVVWVLGLVALVAWFLLPLVRRRSAAVAARPVSLADRLRPLVEGAIARKLSQPELAGLERALLAYWRKRLDLEAADPAHAISTLRAHAEAGPLLNELEAWLHRPGPPAPVDVAELLRPYRDLPPDALDLRPEPQAVAR